MKKIRQHTLCVLLAFVLCVFCFQFSVVAADSNEVNINLIESLRNVEPNKADFGLENVDFEDFQISSPIKSYVYTTEGFAESYEYQPLLIDGQLTAFAIKIWEDTTAGYQITTNLVSEINSFSYNKTSVALVYDRMGCWLYDGEELMCLHENAVEDEQRATLEEEFICSSGQLELTNVSVHTSLEYVSTITPRSSVLLVCSVPYIQQLYRRTCWAATITSILNYTGNSLVTQEDVIRQQFVVLRDMGITTEEAEALIRSYGLDYELRDAPTGGNLYIRNLRDGYPIYASFNVIGGNRHACVIYVYHIMSCYMYVMDPECGSIYIPCPESGEEYTYVSPYSNSTLVLHKVVSMYD